MFKNIIFSLLILSSVALYGEETHEKLVILGSGPAGLTMAIFTGQADLKPLVIEGGECDGQLSSVHVVENYPGFPEGINGEELYDRMYLQAEKFGARFIELRVKNVDLSERPFRIVLETDDVINCDALVVALGSKVRWLGLESEQQLIGKGVSASAICDAHLFNGKEVVVVGSADSALEQALLLAGNTSKVTVISRSDRLSGSQYLRSHIFESPKIHVIWNSTVEEILDVEKGYVTGIRLRDKQTRKINDYSCDGVFISIGRQPNTDLFVGQLEMMSNGILMTKENSTETNVPGVFACGDIADTKYRKLITAAGSGCQAAADA